MKQANQKENTERIKGVMVIILTAFSIATFVIVTETILMKWEMWAVPLLVLSIIMTWTMQIRNYFSIHARTYLLAIVFMGISFFHGVHETSMFDMALIMCFVQMLFSLLDEVRIINLVTAEYFLLFLYQSVLNVIHGYSYEIADFSRIALNFFIVLLTAHVSKSTIIGRLQVNKNIGKAIVELEKLHHYSEDFLANVSWKLHEPINEVINLGTSLLKDEQDVERSRMERGILQASKRMEGQIADIRLFSEIDRRKMQIEKHPYQIRSIITGLAEEFYDVRKINLVFDVFPEIPATMIGDSRWIRKILWHLLDNAVKFTKEGGVHVRLHTEEREYGVNLCMDVSDTGIGIDEEKKEDIINGRYQMERRNDQEGAGIGLGLPLVYGLSHAMGGFVRIDSIVGHGTKIHVTVPQQVQDASPCMSVPGRESLRLASYLHLDHCKVPLLREYYQETMIHLVQGLKMPLHNIKKFSDIEMAMAEYQFTHFFVGRQEYMESMDYFEKLSKKCSVYVITDEDCRLAENSQVTLIQMPVNGFVFASILTRG